MEIKCPHCGLDKSVHSYNDDGYEDDSYWSADVRDCLNCGQSFSMIYDESNKLIEIK